MMSDNRTKRKAEQEARRAASKKPRFNAKPQHNISSTKTQTAYPNGELNVSRFVRIHENEIRSLEKAMTVAKKGLARRAFQDVPRDLRRRTGSHNPQRVPKRLRIRAKTEAKEDNTPIGKNKSGSGIGKSKSSKKWLRKEGIERSRTLAKKKERKKTAKDFNKITVIPEVHEAAGQIAKRGPKSEQVKTQRARLATLAKPPMPASRFRRRQVNKTWLPTHIWHVKRAHITPSKEPLWRFAIPLAPNVKAYRVTHRAASLRGAVAWDTSYMSTIGLQGVEASIIGLLKGLHFAQEDRDKPWQDQGFGKKWRNGTRAWEGWVYEREGKYSRKIAQVAAIWCAKAETEGKKRKVFIRVHPSAFLQLWNEVLRIAKVQKPSVVVEDLRFEIGSIRIMGPAAAETLCSVLNHRPTADLIADGSDLPWPILAPVTDTGMMPTNPIISFHCSDPRLRDPPRTAKILKDDASQTKLVEALAAWPFDLTPYPSSIFERNARLAAQRSLPSQQSINRRKSAAIPGQYPEVRSSDPSIPSLSYVSSESKSWTVLLPWKCVLPVWRCLMRYPVSTGGTPRFGGIKELRQVNFERSKPLFPFDYPGTEAGWAWELQERIERKNEWTRRPRGKRIEWTTIDLGNNKKGEFGDPWACDWERLLPRGAGDEHASPSKRSESQLPPLLQLSTQEVSRLFANRSQIIDAPFIFTVKISMVQKGVPTNCARVYRLPTSNAELRSKWMSLFPSAKPTAISKRAAAARIHSNKISKHQTTREMATHLVDGDRQGKLSSGEYPVVPDEEDLIGFVTTGNYNLREGQPTAIANLVLQRAFEAQHGRAERAGSNKEEQICIVREAGQSLGRLATWEVV